jgi:hypothetical protein
VSEPDRLTAARAVLHQALRDTFATLATAATAAADDAGTTAVAGWHPDRAHLHIPRQLITPCGWVEVPTVHQAPDSASRAQAATFPVFVALDGEDRAQAEAQDQVLAYGWDALTAASVPGTKVTVQTAGPGEVDTGGTTQRGVVFSVRVQLMRSTWCSQTIVPAPAAD